jgi:hypothetical protein
MSDGVGVFYESAYHRYPGSNCHALLMRSCLIRQLLPENREKSFNLLMITRVELLTEPVAPLHASQLYASSFKLGVLYRCSVFNMVFVSASEGFNRASYLYNLASCSTVMFSEEYSWQVGRR